MHRHKQSLFAQQEEQEDNYGYKSKYSSGYIPQQYQPTIYGSGQEYTGQYQPYGYGTGYGYDSDWFGKPSTYQYQKVDYSSKYSFASTFEYKRPDYKKIREKLKEKQLQLNRQGYSIKIEYGGNISFSRTAYGFAKVYCPSVSIFDSIRKFLDKNTHIGIIKLGVKDEKIYESISSCDYIDVDSTIIPTGKIKHLFQYADLSRPDYNLYRDSVIRGNLQDDSSDNKDKNFGYGGRGKDRNKFEIKKDLVTKLSDIIKNKLKVKSDIRIKNVSLNKGKRINRNFILNYSYKPLEYISTFLRKKKKVLMIIDGSGSMKSIYPYEKSFHYKASLSAFALRDTGLFDTNIFYTTENLLTSSQGYTAHGISGSEGFEYMESRLSMASIDYSMFDYIFIFTDLKVSSDSQQAIANVCGLKKHIVFSFDNRYIEQYKNMYSSMNVKYVQSSQDIIDSIVKFV